MGLAVELPADPVITDAASLEAAADALARTEGATGANGVAARSAVAGQSAHAVAAVSRRRGQPTASAAASSVTRRAAVGAGAAALVAVGAAAFSASARNAPPGDPRALLASPTSTPSRTAPPRTPVTPAPKPPAGERVPAAGAPYADRDASYAGAAPGASGPAGMQLGSAGAAAASTGATAFDNQVHLLSRTTFGARASDTAALGSMGIDAWLGQQLAPASIPDPMGDASWAAFPQARLPIAAVVAIETALTDKTSDVQNRASEQTAFGTLGAQVFSQRQLYEVVVDIFTNLLNVTIPGDSSNIVGADYVNVIRTHALGRYADMLHDAMRHPAMLTYLNNEYSNRANVNENLGRELMELHTIGVTSGYTQSDVRNSAYILSGRRFDYKTNEFVFDPNRHFRGTVSTFNFTHPNTTGDGGLDVGDLFIDSLAHAPATAKTIARKFAVRFVSDTPPQSILDRLAAAYLDNDTQIVPMLQVLFSSTEFWNAARTKWRRPLEDAVGAARAIGVEPGADLAQGIRTLFDTLRNLGHAPLSWEPPDGFPDVAKGWESASGMVGRWNMHRNLTQSNWRGMQAPKKLSDELAPTAGQTYAQWVAAIANRVIGRPTSEEHTAVLLAYLGVSGTAMAKRSDGGRAPAIAALLLDSPYFQLR